MSVSLRPATTADAEALWTLVAEAGAGLARTLHDAAVDEAGRRGFERMRLIVAAGYGRARRFYEREGWAAHGDEVFDPVPGLVILEYRRKLRGDH